MLKNLTSDSCGARRRGISIVEVLTSMAVATIGVFGIMVMIPFAIKQSQSGLDRDAANIVGRNAAESLQAYGFLRVINNPLAAPAAVPLGGCIYYSPNPADGGGPAIAASGAFLGFDLADPRAFHLDPIRMSEDLVVRGPTTRFPMAPYGDIVNNAWDQTTFPAPPASLLINSVNATNNSGVPFTKTEANRIFRSFDNLVFGNTDYNGVEFDDVDPPQQYFDLTPSQNSLTGTSPVRRQASGRISWSALMVPIKDDATVATAPAATPASGFRTHILVYADRSIIDPLLGTGELESQSFVGEVARNPYASDPTTAPPERVSGFVQSVREIPLLPLLNPVDIESIIRRDDWVMLINRRPEPDPALTPRLPVTEELTLDGDTIRFRADEAGYAIQVEFCRVVSTDNFGGNPFITVDGGSFDFYNLNVPQTETYVVHLPNVVNVYERTISVER